VSTIQEVLQAQVAKGLQNLLPTHAHTQTLLIAVSGGVDSMVLLQLLRGYRETYGQQFAVVHVNHGLRDSALRDETLVRRVCAEWGFPCYVHEVSAQDRAMANTSVEAAARAWRLQAFRRVAKQLNCEFVLLAHHADDQVETVLWRWLRGTTLRGLAGIRVIQGLPGLTLIRPLLGADKSQLIAYADALDIPYCTDETNASTLYTRNMLRHEVVPALKKLQPRLTDATYRLTTVLRAEDDYLTVQANNVYDELVTRCDDGTFRLPIHAFRMVPLALQRRVIQIILYCFASVDWTFTHTEDVLGMALSHRPSGSLSLPAGISVTRMYDVLIFGIAIDNQNATLQPLTWVLEECAELTYTWAHTVAWKFQCRRWTMADAMRPSGKMEAYFPDIRSVTVKSVERGARIALFGLAGTKKVQDVFTDCKVPKVWRPQWPAIWVDDAVAWLPGLVRSAHALLPDPATTGWILTALPPEIMRGILF